MVIGAAVGVAAARQFTLPAELIDLGNMNEGFLGRLDAIGFFSAVGVGTVWLHNLRAVVLATLLGIFSFGVLGALVLMLPLTLIAYIAANVAAAGYSVSTFLFALVLPHGVLEIPAMILTGAVIINLGATLAAPAQDKTIGEAWLYSLAKWAKIIIGLVLPLFLAAALVEVFLTPHIAVLLLSQ
jgi:uncharacterized membrane protein SpoIIM required for sporulation